MQKGRAFARKAKSYFGIEMDCVRTISVVTIDAGLSDEQLRAVQTEIFTNPVTHLSSYDPLDIEFDWTIWVGFRPGVRDNPGSTAVEAIEDLLNFKFGANCAVYTSKRYCITGDGLNAEDMDKIAGQLLANNIIQQWKIFSADQWNPAEGIGLIIPKVILNHVPTVTTIPVDSEFSLKEISDERNLALNSNDIPTIRAYFMDKNTPAARAQVGLERSYRR